jgi:HNH endonuclease
MKQKNLEFPTSAKKKVTERSGNRCERCGIDFDDDFIGEFHHIIPIIYGGNNGIDNCSLLCHNCHLSAPNVKDKRDLLIYKYFFLRFASFKEAAQYYRINNRFDLNIKIAQDIAKMFEK